MNYWIVPWNKNNYNLDAAIGSFGYVDWRQFFNFEIGDVVFIYCTLPCGRLVYELEVEKVNIPYNEISDDESFYVKKTGWVKMPPKGYVRFRLVSPLNRDNEELSRTALVRNGMTDHLQRPIKIRSELLQHILNNKDNRI